MSFSAYVRQCVKVMIEQGYSIELPTPSALQEGPVSCGDPLTETDRKLAAKLQKAIELLVGEEDTPDPKAAASSTSPVPPVSYGKRKRRSV